MGVLLIDQCISITKSGNGKVIVQSGEEGKRPDARDLTFDLGQYAFREFGVEYNVHHL
jgi:hypothetical protein